MANFTAQAPWALSYSGQPNYFGEAQLAAPEVYTVVPWVSLQQAVCVLGFRGAQVKVWNPTSLRWELAPTGV